MGPLAPVHVGAATVVEARAQGVDAAASANRARRARGDRVGLEDPGGRLLPRAGNVAVLQRPEPGRALCRSLVVVMAVVGRRWSSWVAMGRRTRATCLGPQRSRRTEVRWYSAMPSNSIHGDACPGCGRVARASKPARKASQVDQRRASSNATGMKPYAGADSRPQAVSRKRPAGQTAFSPAIGEANLDGPRLARRCAWWPATSEAHTDNGFMARVGYEWPGRDSCPGQLTSYTSRAHMHSQQLAQSAATISASGVEWLTSS